MQKNGFTLLELMVTLAIASILISVGVPGFRNVIMDNRLVNHANQFVTSVNLARSSAVRFQRNATICASANFDAALPTCSGGSNWSQGWIVWVDKDRDDATDTNEIITVHEPLNGSVTLTSGAAGRFSYDARGFGTTAADDMTLCDNRDSETGRVIKVNNVGRTSVTRQTCS
jgi:type IV fimbrial biogenesis protein FimT